MKMSQPTSKSAHELNGVSARLPAVIIYDGECGFCAHWIGWLDARLGSPVRPAPSSSDNLNAYGISRADADQAVQWAAGDKRAAGARAVAAWLQTSRKRRWRLLGDFIAARPIAPIAEAVYRLVARNRHRLPSGGSRRSH